MSKIINAYKKLSTSVISDAMDRTNVMCPEIKPLWGNPTIAGFAMTVHCLPDDNTVVHQAIYETKEGEVLVVDVGGYVDRSVWGFLLTKACQIRGIEAVVIDGSTRDVDEISASNFPVYCRGVTPKGSHKAMGGFINAAIMCGGVLVNPGDLIVGDSDGVVVVPKEMIVEIMIRSKTRAELEKRWLKKITEGATTMRAIGLE